MALHPVIHLNEDEACVYTNETTIEAAAKALYAISKNTVIVTNGENGAYYYDGSEFVHVPPVPVTEIVDTIGAGDGHIGAVMACLSKGMNLYDAIYKANKASSIVVATKGALISDEVFAAAEI